jgi:hypothetical protein
MRIGEAKNDKELLEALETARQRRLDLRRGWETQWWNNIALVTGDHYATWNPNLSKFEDRDPTFDFTDDKQPRLVVNHALTVARTELSKLTKSRPIMDVLANSDESTDIAAAKVGRSALDYAEWRFRLQKLRKQALWWMIQTGLGAVYVGWDYLDDKAGELNFVIDPNTGEPTFNPGRQRELKQMFESGELDAYVEEKFPLGECQFQVFSPFQLLPDETCLDFDQIQDLITTEIADVDVIRGIYGKDASKVEPDSDSMLGIIEQRSLARAGIAGGFGTGANTANTVDGGVKVHTFWLLPGKYRGNKYLERGKYVRWTNGGVTLDISEGFPFTDGRMPFVFFQHIPTSMSIWPDSIMTHIRGANLEIDKTISQLISNKDYMSNPMWRIATQHKIKGEIKNVAGAIVRYRHVPNIPPPEPIQGLQMPQQVENLLVGLRSQILDISGQGETSRGRVPSGVRSGVAVAYLQEEDDTKIAPTIENMEEAISLMGSLTLERFSQYYTTSRLLRFYRRDGIFDVVKFKGADLKNNTDVVTQAGSAMPKSKAAKQQYALELVSLGILKDPHKIEQILELGQGEPDDTDKAIAQANRENNYMLHGLPDAMFKPGEIPPEEIQKVSVAVAVKAWHNHQLHIQRHTSAMMDEEFDKLAISHPGIVQLFDEHIAMHQQELQKQQQEQMQMLMAAKGAPDGPPGGGQTSHRQISDVPDVIGGGVVDNSAMTIHQ